jgi:hypothetical protein
VDSGTRNAEKRIPQKITAKGKKKYFSICFIIISKLCYNQTIEIMKGLNLN